MAFIKELTLENGTSGDYWKIVDVRINYLEYTASIVFGLFKDKVLNDSKYGTVHNEKLMLEQKAFNFVREEDGSFVFDKENIMGKDVVAYAYKKTLEYKDSFFVDAVSDVQIPDNLEIK